MNKRVVLSLALLLSSVGINASDAGESTLAKLRAKLPACPLSEDAQEYAKTAVQVAGAALAFKLALDHHAVVTDKAVGLGSRFIPGFAKTSTRALTRGAADLVPGVASNLFNQAMGMMSREALALAAGFTAVNQAKIREAARELVADALDSNLPGYTALVGGPVIIAQSNSVLSTAVGVLTTAWALSNSDVRDAVRPSITVTTGGTEVNNNVKPAAVTAPSSAS